MRHFVILSFLLTLFSFFRFCSNLPLPTANAATFPDMRGQLTFPILFFMYSFSIRISWQSNSLLPSFLSGGQNRDDDRRKNITWLLAKNPAWYNRKCVFNTRILCPNSYRSRWSGMASHSFLQRRSAPRKAVRLLPDKRGQLFCVRHFVIFHFYIYKLEFFLP